MSRKRYSVEFKDEACRLVNEQGYSISRAARELGLSYTALRDWLKTKPRRGAAGASAGGLSAETNDPGALRARIRDLEARLRRAEMEKDILKKATAFFAKQSR